MPTLEHEHSLLARGFTSIAGVDEAGRGCWAGPVVAAAVVLGPKVLAEPAMLAGVNDSKQLSASQRTRFAQAIRAVVAAVGVGVVPAYLIDSFGIVRATRLAMELAVLELPRLPDALLIDALRLPSCALPQQDLIRGDSLSLSIAAASIIAKTKRDLLMQQLERWYPRYGFGKHKGYGTAAHAQAIQQHGLTPQHRRSFRPMWASSYKEILHAT